MNKPLVIVISGPTASGKTALSIELANKINGEIISADSMQIYEDMSIGTAKPTKEEMQGIKHYLIDCISPKTRYSVSEYKKRHNKCNKRNSKQKQNTHNSRWDRLIYRLFNIWNRLLKEMEFDKKNIENN